MSGFDYSLLGRRVLCAVSGGADSMYLLHRCLEGAAENGFGVCAAHYNHCLRGEESERDEAFVRSECARLDVELRVGRGDVSGYAASHGMGTEEAARTLRYAFLEQAADELLNISGIEASFVLYPQDGQTIISARSIGDANVQVILEPLGGGGNAATAGAQLRDCDVKTALDRLVASIDQYYDA